MKLKRSHLSNINDVNILLNNGYEPNRLLLFFTVSDDILRHLLVLMAVNKIRLN